ncbi:hypothetical protein TBLA_0I01770 [Henningerozyma blattae CBS 6284]|uniref:ADP-ribose 1''-phosphate phosphatase n=1 Tax=Henningerozyma blattae (strain ATCC 34711 / CBS 6284 / DSM 70876 / NBRC 10599 / NRRL Y-10934 / UCD 77-7) TaxID=1071380 RepID=I2H8Y3_HENB6|nr:hypothetical protein TBLA_0I01770 [Tetrapisispora blattae CBS 6284]CCH62835.1 hypothetical protein TBLA_0I01770 [Tetrapisispora blattae CBS 6284]
MSTIRYVKGNILNKQKYNRMIIHSCNCDGSWGGGIAYQLALKYPKAEKKYIEICDKYGYQLLGKSMILSSYSNNNSTERVLIACLFTSAYGGGNCDIPESILKKTERSLIHLNELIQSNGNLKAKDSMDSDILEFLKDIDVDKISLKEYKLEMPKINSGIFGVPWEKTERVLQEFKDTTSFTVYEL